MDPTYIPDFIQSLEAPTHHLNPANVSYPGEGGYFIYLTPDVVGAEFNAREVRTGDH